MTTCANRRSVDGTGSSGAPGGLGAVLAAEVAAKPSDSVSDLVVPGVEPTEEGGGVGVVPDLRAGRARGGSRSGPGRRRSFPARHRPPPGRAGHSTRRPRDPRGRNARRASLRGTGPLRSEPSSRPRLRRLTRIVVAPAERPARRASSRACPKAVLASASRPRFIRIPARFCCTDSTGPGSTSGSRRSRAASKAWRACRNRASAEVDEADRRFGATDPGVLSVFGESVASRGQQGERLLVARARPRGPTRRSSGHARGEGAARRRLRAPRGPPGRAGGPLPSFPRRAAPGSRALSIRRGRTEGAPRPSKFRGHPRIAPAKSRAARGLRAVIREASWAAWSATPGKPGPRADSARSAARLSSSASAARTSPSASSSFRPRAESEAGGAGAGASALFDGERGEVEEVCVARLEALDPAAAVGAGLGVGVRRLAGSERQLEKLELAEVPFSREHGRGSSGTCDSACESSSPSSAMRRRLRSSGCRRAGSCA